MVNLCDAEICINGVSIEKDIGREKYLLLKLLRWNENMRKSINIKLHKNIKNIWYFFDI